MHVLFQKFGNLVCLALKDVVFLACALDDQKILIVDLPFEVPASSKTLNFFNFILVCFITREVTILYVFILFCNHAVIGLLLDCMIKDFSSLACNFLANVVILLILWILPGFDNCGFEILVSCVIWVRPVRPSASENPVLINCNVWKIWVCNVSTVGPWFWNGLSVVFKDRLFSSGLFREKMSSLFVLWDPSRHLKTLLFPIE